MASPTASSPGEIRREFAAELIAYAESQASEHFALREQAIHYGKDDMAQRAEHCVNAWKGVALRLRLDFVGQIGDEQAGRRD